jgi:hypothetical protein
MENKLTIKEIMITLLIAHLCSAYLNADLNPMNWSKEQRFMQIAITAVSLAIKSLIKLSK